MQLGILCIDELTHIYRLWRRFHQVEHTADIPNTACRSAGTKPSVPIQPYCRSTIAPMQYTYTHCE